MVVEIGEDVVRVEFDGLFLIRLARVNVDDGDAAGEQFIDRFDVHRRVSANRPIAEYLFEREVLIGLPFDLSGIG